jgi:hypothetical protein
MTLAQLVNLTFRVPPWTSYNNNRASLLQITLHIVMLWRNLLTWPTSFFLLREHNNSNGASKKKLCAASIERERLVHDLLPIKYCWCNAFFELSFFTLGYFTCVKVGPQTFCMSGKICLAELYVVWVDGQRYESAVWGWSISYLRNWVGLGFFAWGKNCFEFCMKFELGMN